MICADFHKRNVLWLPIIIKNLLASSFYWLDWFYLWALVACRLYFGLSNFSQRKTSRFTIALNR